MIHDNGAKNHNSHYSPGTNSYNKDSGAKHRSGYYIMSPNI